MPSRTLNVVVSGDARGLNRTLDQVERQSRKTERSFISLGRSGSIVNRGFRDIGHGAAYALGAGGFGGGLYAVFDVTKKVISEFRESQTVSRQTAAVLKSTGDAANISAKGVQNLATAISRKSGIDDETIATGENMLLTFTKIRNETGKGRDIFNQATQAITDMSVAMNRGATPSAEQLRSTAIQVGKALQDPIRGATALRRVGVALTKQQQEQIKAFENSGHHMQAQRLILAELTKEFGGSAARQRTAAKSLNVTLGNLAEGIGGVLAPAMDGAAAHLNKFIDEMQRGRGEGGRFRRQVEAMAKDIAPFIQAAARAGTVVAANFGKIVAAVRIATTALRFWGRVAITTNKAVIELAGMLVHAGRSFVGFARGGVNAVANGFRTIKRAADALIGPVKWLLDHIPKIHIPKVNLGPIHLGDPRPGWEQFMAGINAMPGFPGGGTPGGTLAKAGQLASRFGLRITSGYRSPGHNAAVGGVEGSLHTHGSPSNPGAVDLVGSMGNMQRAEDYARSHFHPRELLIHNAGSGTHLHVGFGDPRGAEKAQAIANAAGSSPNFNAGARANARRVMRIALDVIRQKFPGARSPIFKPYGGVFQATDASGEIYWPDWLSNALGMVPGAYKGVANTPKLARDMALDQLVHEFGHAMQAQMLGKKGFKNLTQAQLEGGAVNFSRDFAPLVAQALGFGGFQSPGLAGDPYAGYLRSDRKKYGRRYYGFGDPQANAAGAGALSKKQLEALWIRAGGSADVANLAAAVALAESGGRVSATSANPAGGQNLGLWQIWSGNRGATFDPLGNARAAVGIWRGAGGTFARDWETYTNGSYRQFLGGGSGGRTAPHSAPRGPTPQQIAAQQRRHLQAELKRERAGFQKVKQTLATARKAQRVGTSIDDPWLQTWIQHQQDLMDAGLLDPIVGRDNIANVLDQFSKGKGVSEHDRLSAIAQARDLRFQNLSDLTSNAPDSVSDEGVRLAHIDALVRAGDLTDEQGRAQKIASLQDALGTWNLTDDARLGLRGELNDLMKEQTASTEDLTNAIKDLQKSLDEQTNFGKSVAATEAGAMARWVTSVVSRVQGYDISGRGLTPAYGVARRS